MIIKTVTECCGEFHGVDVRQAMSDCEIDVEDRAYVAPSVRGISS